MEVKRKSNLNIIAGILFILHAIGRIINICRYIGYENYSVGIWTWLYIAASLIIAVGFFIGKPGSMTQVILTVGFGIFAVGELLPLFRGETYYSQIPFIYFSWLLADIFMILCALGGMVEEENGLTRFVRKIWFLPAIFALLAYILNGQLGLITQGYSVGGYFLNILLPIIVNIVRRLLGARYLTKPYISGYSDSSRTNSNSGGTVQGDGYISMMSHVLLLFFTLGIWFLMWIYRTTGYTNRDSTEPQRNPTTKLLLCMFVPFYQIYWTYKTAQRIDRLASERGIMSDMSTLCLILAIFVPVIPPIIMQDKINAIAVSAAPLGGAGTPGGTAHNNAYAQYSGFNSQQHQAASQQNKSATEELKAYKELLDSGVITQEEFDAKKKQILDL